MSEMKVYRDPKAAPCYREFYEKSEADKVIKGLKEGAKKLILDNYLKDREIKHHKYKRCLAKAETCQARYDEEDAKVNGCGASWEYISKEMKYWERWQRRWLELAEKFKEVK